MVSLISNRQVDVSNDRCDLLGHRLAELSDAEREVFELARQGLSNKEIADARGRSVPTVKNQLQAVFLKLGISSRCRLIAWTRGPAQGFSP
jgi:DNA-binding CsgD family transcriptional regulator